MNKSKTFFWSSIDLVIQSVFILCMMLSVLYAPFGYWLIIHIFLGIYQYLVSALPNMIFGISTKRTNYLRQIHFYFSSFFLVIFFLNAANMNTFVSDYIRFVVGIIGVIIIFPILMFFYYYITYRDYQEKELILREERNCI